MSTLLSTQIVQQVEVARNLMKGNGYATKTIESYSGVWHHLIEYSDRFGQGAGLAPVFCFRLRLFVVIYPFYLSLRVIQK